MGTSEEEEEDYLVHVEFDSLLECDTFKDPNLFFKVIGIDSEKPIMQIGDQVFTGTYCDIPGTSLFFEEDDNKIADDAVFAKTAGNTLQYKYKTRKSLVMRRVFIKKKDLSSGDKGTNRQEEMTEEEMAEISELDQLGLLSAKRNFVNSEYLIGSGNGLEMSDVKVKKGPRSRSRGIQLRKTCVEVDIDEKNKNDESRIVSKNVQGGLEPVAGPSWAPDISPDCKSVLSTTVNADEMSRLIAEQMTLESDINLQNSVHGDMNVD